MKRTPLKRGTKQMKRTGFRVSPKKRATRQIGANKAKSMAWYKKELDRVFSLYIRKIHPARCYTCGIPKHRKKLQCGHFVPRQYLATRWSVDNCRPQCVGCNLFGNGQLLDFEENLKRELGEETVENLKKSRHKVVKLDRIWYENEIKKYAQT